MTVRFHLQRWGSKKKPYYHVVVADSRNSRDGRVLERVGTYNPNCDPSEVKVKEDRVKYWYGVGARPSNAVNSVFKVAKIAF